MAFIDWGGAGPIDPLVDLAQAAWVFVPLAPPEQLLEAGFDRAPDIGARLRLFVDRVRHEQSPGYPAALQRCLLIAAEPVKNALVTAAEAADALECHAHEFR